MELGTAASFAVRTAETNNQATDIPIAYDAIQGDILVTNDDASELQPDGTLGREGNKARDPRAREWAAVVIPAGIAGLAWLCCIAIKAQP